jgi:predicted transcriptional regulator
VVTMEEARAYLRMDSGFEDALIGSLLLSAEILCTDVARLSKAEWDALSDYTGDSEEIITIRQEEKSKGEALQMKEILRVGVLYALGYLFEHREEADHHALVMTLRNLLFAVREGVF